MSKEDPIKASVEYLVSAGWTEEQATHLLRALKSDSPEKLWELAPKWVEHCHEKMSYVTNLLGLVAMGIIDVTHKKGEWYFELNDKGIEVGKQMGLK